MALFDRIRDALVAQRRASGEAMLLDISQPVDEHTACWPGDTPFSCGWSATLAGGAPVNVGRVTTSPHVGTHVDAPYHFDERGARIGGLSLDAFVGPALVIDATGRDELGADVLRGQPLAQAPRVLFHTQRRSDPTRFLDGFPLLTPDAIDALAAARVRLVGIDAPSYDAVGSKTLDIHKALAARGIVNVENLRLDDITPGRYELLAAPVAWRDMDAAPLRALLRK